MILCINESGLPCQNVCRKPSLIHYLFFFLAGLVCKTASMPCDFPFSFGDVGYSSCIKVETAMPDRFVCPVANDNITEGERVWGVCNTGCLTSDGESEWS